MRDVACQLLAQSTDTGATPRELISFAQLASGCEKVNSTATLALSAAMRETDAVDGNFLPVITSPPTARGGGITHDDGDGRGLGFGIATAGHKATPGMRQGYKSSASSSVSALKNATGLTPNALQRLSAGTGVDNPTPPNRRHADMMPWRTGGRDSIGRLDR